jgi:hypothetical protein
LSSDNTAINMRQTISSLTPPALSDRRSSTHKRVACNPRRDLLLLTIAPRDCLFHHNVSSLFFWAGVRCRLRFLISFFRSPIEQKGRRPTLTDLRNPILGVRPEIVEIGSRPTFAVDDGRKSARFDRRIPGEVYVAPPILIKAVPVVRGDEYPNELRRRLLQVTLEKPVVAWFIRRIEAIYRFRHIASRSSWVDSGVVH